MEKLTLTNNQKEKKLNLGSKTIFIERIIFESDIIKDWEMYIAKKYIQLGISLDIGNGCKFFDKIKLSKYPIFELCDVYYPNEDIESASMEKLTYGDISFKLLSIDDLFDDFEMTIYYKLID